MDFSRMHIICVMCMLLYSCALLAQADTIAESRRLSDVNVSAKRAQLSATSVQTLTTRQLNQQGIQNVADAVRHFNGTNVKDYGGIGGLKTVSVRSFGATHTAVSYDGVVLSNCQAGPIDVGRFNLNNVGTLSLSIGQADALLQPAKAFASVAILSVSTLQPVFNGRKTLCSCRLQGGSFGYFNANVNVARQLGKRTSLSVNADFSRADGDYPFTLVNGRQTTRLHRANSDVRTVNCELNLFRTDSCSRLHVKAYAFGSERGLPGSVVLYYSVANERLWDRNFFLQSDYQRRLGDLASCRFQAKYNYSWNKYEDVNVKYANGRQLDLNTQNEGYVSISAMCEPLRCLSASLACDASLNALKSNMPNNPQPLRTTLVSALNVRCHRRFFTATATLVATHIAEKVKLGESPADLNRLSPAFGLNFSLSENIAVRAMYKSTYRVPTFNELYYTVIGNTYLRPERAKEFNVGTTCALKINNMSLSIIADAFRNYVDDKIVAVPTTYVWKMHNCGRADIWGIDASLQCQVVASENVGIDLSGGYSYQKAIDVTSKSDKNYRHQIPYTPLHSGNWQVAVNVPWFTLGYSAIASGRRYSMKQNIPANQINGYVEHTASLSRDFDFGRCSFRLKFDAVNFTDKQYDVIRYYPMPGRSWRFLVMINF